MKILIGLLIAGLLLIPSVVSAECHERCCDLYAWRQFYEVEYFDSGNWTSEIVEAWAAREAAEKLGLRAGYDCWASFSHTVHEPILNEYRVSFREDGVWVTKTTDAETREQAAAYFGKRAGYDCFVGNV